MRPSRRYIQFTLLASAFAISACDRSNSDSIVSGRIEVDNIHVGSKIGGRVWQVNFEEGEDIAAGQPIIVLEQGELEAQLNQAKAEASRSQAELDLLLAGTRKEDILRAEAVVAARAAELQLREKGFRDEEVREAEAEVASATSNEELAEREWKRAEELFSTSVIDESELDAKRNTHQTTVARLQGAEQRLALMRSGSRPEEIAMASARLKESEADLERLENGARPEEVSAAKSTAEAARANVARIESLIEETVILAPVDAMVETLDLEPGDLVRGEQGLAVLNMKNQPWVRCFVPQVQLDLVKPGNNVTIQVDAYPGESFKGVIRRVSSQAEFTPRNVQTKEKRAELVFEVKVDVVEGMEKLRAGMYADVVLQP